MASDERLKISEDDLFSEAVEDYLVVQEGLRRDLHESEPQPLFTRIIYSSWFYLAIAAGLGGVLAWVALEPLIDDRDMLRQEIRAGMLQFQLEMQMAGQPVTFDVPEPETQWGNFLIFPIVAGGIGLFLGAGEGIMCRNLRRAVLSGLVGLGIGFGAGLVLLIPSGLLYNFMTGLAESADESEVTAEQQQAFQTAIEELVAGQPYLEVETRLIDRMFELRTAPTGFAFLLQMMGRAAAWAVIAVAAGLGQGIATRSKAVIFNGLVGGVLGGLLGGLLFDPVDFLLTSSDGEAALSRLVGFTCIGLLVGLFVGLVEGWTKTAWLLMRQGPLAGKQFVLFRDTTVLGSSPNADVYLFKDERIEPRHAQIKNRGGRFEIEDIETPDGTYVNGQPITRHVLRAGDQITLGRTVLEFSVREQ
jgi:hypothetical protein